MQELDRLTGSLFMENDFYSFGKPNTELLQLFLLRIENIINVERKLFSAIHIIKEC